MRSCFLLLFFEDDCENEGICMNVIGVGVLAGQIVIVIMWQRRARVAKSIWWNGKTSRLGRPPPPL